MKPKSEVQPESKEKDIQLLNCTTIEAVKVGGAVESFFDSTKFNLILRGIPWEVVITRNGNEVCVPFTNIKNYSRK